MKATNFEFRQRFWIIMVIFWGGFWLYGVDQTNVVESLKIAGTWWIIGVTLAIWVAYSFFVYSRRKVRERSSPQTS